MILVLLNWIYILITAFLCGFAFSRLAERLCSYQMKSFVEILFFGLIIATVYAQLFSLFGGVGIAANLLLLCTCVLFFVLWQKQITTIIYEKWKNKPFLYKITAAVLTLIWCYCTSRGYMHYDSDLYHAQSIRWIEEYGIVKGLGNIHVRFAYNSSFFALSALYSMKDVAGQSLHAVNGLFALLLSLETLKLFFRDGRKEAKGLALSDFARLGAFYYLTLIYRGIVAPASDYCVMCVVFYIVIRWLSYLELDFENNEKSIAPYGLLCVAGVYGVTLKLTAGVILLLVAKPAYMLLKERRYRETAFYIITGVIVLAPWMIRTALISGYLLYPFPALDVLGVDWKMDAAAAALDAAEIKAWGRGLNNAALAGLSVREWFPHWFQTMLPASGKLLILADIACLVVLAGYAVRFIRKKADQLLVLGTVAASYLFWQLSAPLLRYGYAYVLLLITLTAGLLCQHIKKSGRIIWRAAVLLAAVKGISLAGYVIDTAPQPYYIVQKDYGRYELDSFTVENITFYYPKSGDRTGYESFPAVPRKAELALRSGDIRGGFRPAGK